MLDRVHNRVVYFCDGTSCDEFLETEEEDFAFANEIRKAMEWITFKDEDEDWVHFCPDCKVGNR